MGRIAKVGGSPRATASTLPGLSACMYAGDMYVCMYVCTLQYFLSSTTLLYFLAVRKSSDEAEELLKRLRWEQRAPVEEGPEEPKEE